MRWGFPWVSSGDGDFNYDFSISFRDGDLKSGNATYNGVFQDKTSMDRILFAVFTHENKMQGISAPFLLTQTN